MSFPSISTKTVERKSQYELLRLISQFYIVLYHICYIWQGSLKNDSFFQAISISLHIGVIIFVLLSGFFTIKANSKGLIKLLGIFLVYDISEIIYNVIHANNIRTLFQHLAFLSDTHFWFIKTYLFLYLVSPMVNLWLNRTSAKQRWYMTIVFGFVAQYMAITGGDKNMEDGKNLVNFIFLYLVGNQLRYYQVPIRKLSQRLLALCYITLNVILFAIAYIGEGEIFKFVFKFSFPYSSPLLLLNAILLFLIIGKVKLHSKYINWLASSSLAIYLIHANRPYLPIIHEKNALLIQSIFSHNITIFLCYILYTFLIICICIVIDKLFTPIWIKINNFGNKVYMKIGY